jgi:hypothetical protein
MKLRIEDARNIAVKNQTLVFNSNVLVDGDTIKSRLAIHLLMHAPSSFVASTDMVMLCFCTIVQWLTSWLTNLLFECNA